MGGNPELVGAALGGASRGGAACRGNPQQRRAGKLPSDCWQRARMGRRAPLARLGADRRSRCVSGPAVKQPFGECAKKLEYRRAGAAAAKQGMGPAGGSLGAAHVSGRGGVPGLPRAEQVGRATLGRTATRHSSGRFPAAWERLSADDQRSHEGRGHSCSFSRHVASRPHAAAVHGSAPAPGSGASVGFRRVIAVGNGCSAARDPRRWGR